ncbi:TPA: hypothetical protein ACQ75Q_003812 [Bacillus thuringiensis]|nr:hypothetical protein [Bacillus cereus]HDR4798615.1 hypothetical protein [Bacillus cereus]HDR4804630.1 hypothetical protein [Bacillus cereus]HDR4810569.1 hypothetical protein [Bacillus cereus]HDR4833034.1 hypothetical protein [Bacillus cereus]
MAYLEENTAREVKKQINDTTGTFKGVTNLYDVKLIPKMNFNIKVSSLYDGGEEDSNHRPIGTWYYTYNSEGEQNTGGKKYKSAHPNANVVLSSEAKEKLKKGEKYYLSLYMKADEDTQPTIEVKGELATITSKKVKVNNKGYQRVDLLVENSNLNPINQIYIHGNDKTNVYWDDASLTHISSLKKEEDGTSCLSDDTIKGMYKNMIYSYYPREFPINQYESWGGGQLYSISFRDVPKSFQSYVKAYRVKSSDGSLDVTKDSKVSDYITLDIKSYNNGYPLAVNNFTKTLGRYKLNSFSTVSVFAITVDGREIEVNNKTFNSIK